MDRARPINIKEMVDRFRHVPKYSVRGSFKTNPRRESMTLGELKKYDDANHEAILNESKELRFGTLQQAARAKFLAWGACMKKIGVMTFIKYGSLEAIARNVNTFQADLERELNERNDIRTEERGPKELNVEKDGWKSGMYIYYNGDIVYFVSNPYSIRKMQGNIVIVGQVHYCIRTNAPMQIRVPMGSNGARSLRT